MTTEVPPASIACRRQCIADRLRTQGLRHDKAIQNLIAFEVSLDDIGPSLDEEADRERRRRDRLEYRRDRLMSLRSATPCPARPKTAYREHKEKKAHTIERMSKFVAVACPEIEIRVANRRKAVGEDPASVNWRDPGNFCYTQLHKAVAAHDLPAIRCLIEQQHANVNVKDSDHNTPVTLAFLLGFNEAVEYLSAA